MIRYHERVAWYIYEWVKIEWDPEKKPPVRTYNPSIIARNNRD